MRRRLVELSVVVTVVALLFVVANVAAHLYLASPRAESRATAAFFPSPASVLAKDPALAAAVYPGRTQEEISELARAPTYVAHPVLEMMTQPVTSKFYNVGIENLRYADPAGAEQARTALDGRAVWVLGGSTAFGHGVAGGETIAAQLDDIDTSTVPYLNFGVPGAHQRLEVEKLVLLLSKGYRPKRVIFIDGLNDILAVLRTRFLPEETPALPYHAYAHDYNVARLGGADSSLAIALRALPVSRLFLRWEIERAVRDPANASFGYEDVYSAESAYQRDPFRHYALNEARGIEAALTDPDRYAEKLADTYRANLRVISALAKGAGFDAHVFFQPIGFISRTNPFIAPGPAPASREEYEQSALYVLMHALTEKMRAELAAGRIAGVEDLSRADDACPGCWVDAVHYDARMSRMLAEQIAARLH